jgi:AraC family transcriptional regulator, regulatory protein of adaptative response / methylated-DNA-[protein]-cysteine methyltransferase
MTQSPSLPASHRANSPSRLRFGVRPCWLGQVLIAAADQGLCALLLGDSAEELTAALQRRFARSEIHEDDQAIESILTDVVGFISSPTLGLQTPLDARGTEFQHQVWAALREIPLGETASYTAIAQRVGRPSAVRAVAQACGANPLAVVVPCHRVVCRDGSLSGYRWGTDRKRQLLRREQQLLALRAALEGDYGSTGTNCTASMMT